MKKPIHNPTARVTTLIDISPKLLREFADRLEQAAKLVPTKHGSSVIVEFADDITFRYKPDSRAFGSFIEIPPPPTVGSKNHEIF